MSELYIYVDGKFQIAAPAEILNEATTILEESIRAGVNVRSENGHPHLHLRRFLQNRTGECTGVIHMSEEVEVIAIQEFSQVKASEAWIVARELLMGVGQHKTWAVIFFYQTTKRDYERADGDIGHVRAMKELLNAAGVGVLDSWVMGPGYWESYRERGYLD